MAKWYTRALFEINISLYVCIKGLACVDRHHCIQKDSRGEGLCPRGRKLNSTSTPESWQHLIYFNLNPRHSQSATIQQSQFSPFIIITENNFRCFHYKSVNLIFRLSKDCLVCTCRRHLIHLSMQ